MASVPADILDGATRFVPLITYQLAGQPLPALARRLKSAIIRDDPSELLALSMVTSPILVERLANPDDPERFELYELRDALRQVTARWRDSSLDATIDHAQDVAARLVDLDSAILRDHVERTGDSDPFGFLSGLN